jgi:PhoH-like ATPase
MKEKVRRCIKPPRSILGYGISELRGNPKKIIVTDTNPLVNDSKAIDNLSDDNTNAVVIPWIVLGELDALKMDQDLSRQISEVVRVINKKIHNKDENFYIAQGDVKYFTDLDRENADHHVIATCLSIKYQYPNIPVVLVSNDSMVHAVGSWLGIKVEEYKADQVNRIDFERPLPEFFDSDFEMDQRHRFIIESEEHKALVPLNGGAVISSKDQCSRLAVIRKNNLFVPIRENINVMGIAPCSLDGEQNWAQYVAMQQLLDPEIELVTIHGEAGTGKTLLAIAAGIKQVKSYENNDKATFKAGNGNLQECLTASGYSHGHDNISGIYRRVLIARPLIHLGNRDSIGFLPGDLSAKIDPWLMPIYDNIEFIGSISDFNLRQIEKLRGGEGKDERKIEILPLSLIRGRTLANSFVIIDEAQNLTRMEMMAIITRAGEGTKFVLVGDINQMDIRWLDKRSSGLTHVSVKMNMNKLPYFANSYLTQSVRSRMARDAARLL